jgi:ABC-type Fe3+ transport system permease subunit
MKSSLMKKTKRYLAVVLVLLTLMFVGLPIGSIGSTGSNVVAAQTTTRRYRRRHRSFWKKHRDKLTVAGTALGGAAVGGLAGGKKGAAIGALAGGGGGALYTYKLRRRHRRY